MITKIFIILFGFIQCFALDDLTQIYYCKKNKGNCKDCQCWTCSRFKYLDKNGDLK